MVPHFSQGVEELRNFQLLEKNLPMDTNSWSINTIKTIKG